MKKTFLIKMVCIVFVAACVFPVIAQAKNSTGELVTSSEGVPEKQKKNNYSTAILGIGPSGKESLRRGSRSKDSASSKRLPSLSENNYYANILLLLGINCLLLFLILISSKKNEVMP